MKLQGILVPLTLLEKIPLWANLPPATKTVLLRAFKAAIATLVAVLLTAATAGVLFPVEWSPIIVITITTLLQAIDKALRASDEEPPPTDLIDEPVV